MTTKTVPSVEVGDVVLWFPYGTRASEPCAGFVSKLGYDSLSLNVVDPSRNTLLLVEGVRHIEDSRARTPELQEAGAWDLRDTDKKVRAALAQLECLLTK